MGQGCLPLVDPPPRTMAAGRCPNGLCGLLSAVAAQTCKLNVRRQLYPPPSQLHLTQLAHRTPQEPTGPLQFSITRGRPNSVTPASPFADEFRKFLICLWYCESWQRFPLIPGDGGNGQSVRVTPQHAINRPPITRTPAPTALALRSTPLTFN